MKNGEKFTIKDTITLDNRYRINNYLVFQEENCGVYYYLLKLDKREGEYMRIIAGDTSDFSQPIAIDPSGGPYMAIDNFEIEGMILKSIEHIPYKGYLLGFINKKSQ